MPVSGSDSGSLVSASSCEGKSACESDPGGGCFVGVESRRFEDTSSPDDTAELSSVVVRAAFCWSVSSTFSLWRRRFSLLFLLLRLPRRRVGLVVLGVTALGVFDVALLLVWGGVSTGASVDFASLEFTAGGVNSKEDEEDEVVFVEVVFIDEAIEDDDGRLRSEGTGGRFFDCLDDVDEFGVGKDFSTALDGEEVLLSEGGFGASRGCSNRVSVLLGFDCLVSWSLAGGEALLSVDELSFTIELSCTEALPCVCGGEDGTSGEGDL